MVELCYCGEELVIISQKHFREHFMQAYMIIVANL